MTGPREWSAFTKEVLLERARLAIVDPDGEAEAVAPLPLWRAVAIINAIAALDARPKREALSITRLAARSGRDNDAILAALAVANPGAGHGVVRCPGHEDRHPSLSWRLAEERLLLKCFAGCTFDEILAAAA